MDWRKVTFALILLITMAGSFWYVYDFASQPVFHDYVSDEVWYVPASRNILHRLGVTLTYVNESSGSMGVNVIFLNQSVGVKYQYDVEKIALRHGATYEKEYLKFPGVYFEIPPEQFDAFLDDLSSSLPGEVYYVVPGFWYPDKENIQDYLNTEHPFLGKDFIMLGMLIEDRPVNWRVPGIVAFVLTELLVALATYRISKSYLAAIIALVFTVADPTLQAMSTVAMLDIYVAFGVALFVFFLAYEKDRWAAFAAGLAGATKLSGGFGWPVLLVRAFKREKSIVGFLLTVFVLPALGFLLPNVPAMVAVGPEKWLRDFLGSFKWHLSNKGGHPAASPVWEWFVNKKAFALHYDPNVFAQTDPFLLLSMVLFIFALPWLYRRKNGLLAPFSIFWSTVFFFTLQYVLGGTTQFSFYATALVPPAAVVMGVALRELLRWEAFTNSLWLYLEWLLEVKDSVRLRR
ncbi:dolichyl-phosphate-mannose--protein mannosyltransferase [Thermococcus pacificus]|uniref:Dolichyl-phosphate-mannose--protein mannosyltransferase n=1 Tax=Thermococcus pacificus TaxID=71998 RepID=A0A218P8M2_9EURY|nr:dolichyl-phosphate-mannose--protein mannosyltransferase [Thermococcus pacificus]ASJ07141.1 dolichyl-phosphate-mannose--protein mannosyltransferase [Thermococcus pacificus]